MQKKRELISGGESMGWDEGPSTVQTTTKQKQALGRSGAPPPFPAGRMGVRRIYLNNVAKYAVTTFWVSSKDLLISSLVHFLMTSVGFGACRASI